ncbi:CCR4-NOT transcription complex subunit 2-like isoform X2 [Daktulosphaira vitifoliae]|uniref:CCR4-NOT transcription complex subunit 2-like isoform X2 n=1 Tax=Daktulosphaira vitifoliae TaxID=58002 RepID=UPI0021AACB90|nr:CCR4-NOT transcription complex subunit 2-like isoform X2 [Daktulosphaira vitifoliae]
MFTPQHQQLSPNRASINMQSPQASNISRGIFQRGGFATNPGADRRGHMPGIASLMQEWSSTSLANNAMNNYGGSSSNNRSTSGYNLSSQHGFHSAFGSNHVDNGNSAPPILDPSEFPSLTTGRISSSGQGDSVLHSSTMPAGKPYVGMVKAPTSETSEFTMSSKDFPALPGTQPLNVTTSSSTTDPNQQSTIITSGSTINSLDQNGMQMSNDHLDQRLNNLNSQTDNNSQENGNSDIKKGVQTSPDGKVTNIPGSMVRDQFGIVGLLTFIRAAESDPNLVSLALGQDLTALGLNLNSPENIYPTFAGPWADAPCRPQDVEFHGPPEYIINHGIRDKLAHIKLSRYKEDLLFYLFYTNYGDAIQLAAANELYSRDWRYHMEERVWITQAPGLSLIEKTSTYERGTYYVFDALTWRKVPKEFLLEYSKLEGRPTVPNVPLTTPNPL